MPPTAWNMFVKKVFQEGKSKNKSYSFKQALKDASKRKGEMGSATKTKKTKKGGSCSVKLGGKRKSRKNGKN
jgi:hypothetical protein